MLWKFRFPFFLLVFLFFSSKVEPKDADLYLKEKYTIQQKDTVIKPRPDSCKDVVSNRSRVVAILSSGLEVMCDTQTDGGGWTIFQRRINGNLSFYRGWEEYKYGFGDLADGEFYLGNEHIHRITVQSRHELRIDFSFHFLRSKYHAKYARFKILGEPEGYKLMIKGFSGNAGDSLSYHNFMKFSTYDRDKDTTSRHNCALKFKGAWWYNHCHMSNLNGDWGNPKFGLGLNWHTLTGFHLLANLTEMKFRTIGK